MKILLGMFIAIILSRSCVKSATLQKAYLMPEEIYTYEKLFEHNHVGELSTIPYCFYDKSITVSEGNSTGTYEKANITWADYSASLKNQSLLPVQLYFTVQVLQLVSVSEKTQTVNLMIETNKWWKDCRLTWFTNKSGSAYLELMPKKFSRLNLFEPNLRLLEALTPTFTADSLKNVRIWNYGDVVQYHEFLVSAACSIDVHMYPFDIQLCSLTFESILDNTVVNITYGIWNQSIYSASMLGRYMAHDVWALVVLPPTSYTRHTCSDLIDDCTSLGLRFRIILRRQPYYQITNLLLPAFLIVIISSCVFLVPPGAGDKMGFSLSILLSLYMFCQLMYDKMPETGSTVPLLSQYFMVCIALVSTSCLYSTISAVFASACPRVPALLRRLVVVLGPIVMPDLIESCSSQKKQKKCFSSVRKSNRIRSQTNTSLELSIYDNQHEDFKHQDGDASPAVTTLVDSHLRCEGCHSKLGNTKKKFKGFRVDLPDMLTWASVGALFDRCFFAIHLLLSLLVFAVYVVKGYVPWVGYLGIINSINQSDISVICEQLSQQGFKFQDLLC